MMRVSHRECRMKVRFASMTAALTVGVTAAVVIACATASWIYSAHHFDTLLTTARGTALAESELIRVALEHQMMENDRSLITRMVESFGRQARVERLSVLDRYGEERYHSGLPANAAELQIGSETCQACHRLPPDQRGSSRVIETAGGAVLRTVVPIQNRTECHRCHDPSHRINGVLILDYSAGEMRAAISRELWWMILAGAGVALVLVGAIALVIRVAVLRRLQKFETTARQIAAGDLARRVPAEGSDTLAWLAREFNSMADSVTGLVQQVGNERERLENIINSIDDGIVVLDRNRSIVAANEAFIRRADRARQEMLGCCCRDVSPGGCNSHDCPTIACLRTGVRQVRILERLTADGTAVWEEIHASPVTNGSDHACHVVEVWRDISDRRAAEARLAESHRLASLGLLASGFSHELNTPLATVLTCVEGILREKHAGNPDLTRVGENAMIAREQILRCRGVTQQFLRMSRGQPSAPGIVHLNSVVTAVHRLVDATARTHSVRVEIESVGGDIHLRADEAELQNVLINLMLNAIQACSRGGSVSVRAWTNASVHIAVRDTGCGIAPANIKRIFEPFFSLRSGGTGLGLFLSLNYVRASGGDIRVSSTLGEGSTFEVIMPVLRSAAERGVPA
jgi:PAS domain S-box-containing protein